MGGQLATWAGAISDIDYLAAKAADPPWWKAGANVQAEAIEIFAAKKKIEAQRNELRTFVQYSYGQSGWEELLRIEAQVRKRKQATDHRRAEIKEILNYDQLSLALPSWQVSAVWLCLPTSWCNSNHHRSDP
jgi:hypothetical protein